jgi:ERCC4-type nuclease
MNTTVLSSIVVDYREESIIQKLKGKIRFTVSNIPIDIIVGEYAIEIKRGNDFENSIIDGRYINQISVLKQYEKRILALVDDSFNRVKSSSYYGAIARLLKSDINVLRVNEDELIEIILRLSMNTNNSAKIVHLKKEPDILYILSSFPGIGYKRSVMLAEHFTTIRNFANAEQDELSKLLGKSIGERVFKILNEKYMK